MRQFLLLFPLVVGMLMLTPAPAFAKGDDGGSRKEKTAPKSSLDRVFAAEIAALTEAETMLKTISDEKSAKAVKTRLMNKFSILRPILGGTEAQLEELARAQNRVSAVMWELKKKDFFEEVNLQELWTVMTHHFSRRSASLLK